MFLPPSRWVVLCMPLAVAACSDAETTGAGGAGAGGATMSSSTGAGGGLPACGLGQGIDPRPAVAQVGAAASFGPRQETSVVALGGKVYVVGGFTLAGVSNLVEVYDPKADSWSTAAPLPDEQHHTNAAAVGDKLYVLGSLRLGTFVATGESYVYSPVSDQWSAIAPMPAGTQRGAAAVAVIGTQIIVAGGFRLGQAVADVSAYDTVTDSWSTLPALPTPRDHGAAAAIGDTFYLFAGREGAIESQTSEVFSLDLSAAGAAWCERAPMPTARGGIAAAVIDNEIYVLGGEGNADHPSGTFAQVEVYDPSSNRWRIENPLPAGRHGTGAAAIGNTIFMPGGADQQAFGAIGSVARLTVP